MFQNQIPLNTSVRYNYHSQNNSFQGMESDKSRLFINTSSLFPATQLISPTPKPNAVNEHQLTPRLSSEGRHPRRIFSQESPEEKIGGLRKQLAEYNEVMGINHNYHSQPLKKHPDYALSFHDENRLPDGSQLDTSIGRFSVNSQSARGNAHANAKPNFIRLESKSLTPNKRRFSPDNINTTVIQGLPGSNNQSFIDDGLPNKLLSSQVLLVNTPVEGTQMGNQFHGTMTPNLNFIQTAGINPQGAYRLILQARDVNNLGSLGLNPTNIPVGQPSPKSGSGLILQPSVINEDHEKSYNFLGNPNMSGSLGKFTLIEQNGMLYQVPILPNQAIGDSGISMIHTSMPPNQNYIQQQSGHENMIMNSDLNNIERVESFLQGSQTNQQMANNESFLAIERNYGLEQTEIIREEGNESGRESDSHTDAENGAQNNDDRRKKKKNKHYERKNPETNSFEVVGKRNTNLLRQASTEMQQHQQNPYILSQQQQQELYLEEVKSYESNQEIQNPRSNQQQREDEVTEKFKMVIRQNEQLLEERDILGKRLNEINIEHEKMCEANEQLLSANFRLNESNQSIADELRRVMKEFEEAKEEKFRIEKMLKEERERLAFQMESMKHENQALINLKEEDERNRISKKEARKVERERKRVLETLQRTEAESSAREHELLRHEMNAILMEKARIEQESLELLSKNTFLTVEISRLMEEIERMKNSSSLYDQERAKWNLQEMQNRETGQKITILIQDNANLIKLCEDLGNEVGFWREKYVSYDKIRNFDFNTSNTLEMSRLKVTIEDQQKEIKLLQQERDNATIDRSIIDSLKQENANLKQVINGSSTEAEKRKGESDKLKADIEKLKSECEKLKKEREAEEKTKAEKTLEELKKESLITEMEMKLKTVKEENEILKLEADPKGKLPQGIDLKVVEEKLGLLIKENERLTQEVKDKKQKAKKFKGLYTDMMNQKVSDLRIFNNI